MLACVRFYSQSIANLSNTFYSRVVRMLAFRRIDEQVHTMMEESATACVSRDFSQALEKAKEAVSTASFSLVSLFR